MNIAQIDEVIRKNKTILMSSFGLEGLLKSQLKLPLIEKIITGIPGNTFDAINNFFERLEEAYIADTQFKQFKLSEIAKFISVEKSYVAVKMIR